MRNGYIVVRGKETAIQYQQRTHIESSIARDEQGNRLLFAGEDLIELDLYQQLLSAATNEIILNLSRLIQLPSLPFFIAGRSDLSLVVQEGVFAVHYENYLACPDVQADIAYAKVFSRHTPLPLHLRAYFQYQQEAKRRAPEEGHWLPFNGVAQGGSLLGAVELLAPLRRGLYRCRYHVCGNQTHLVSGVQLIRHLTWTDGSSSEERSAIVGTVEDLIG